MGDVMPPIQLAKAMPSNKQGATVEPLGSVRKIGSIREKQRTGVATLEIHIHRKAATIMMESKTQRGRVPARERTWVAKALAIPYLDNAAASANPPRSIIIVPLNMDEKTDLDAAFAVIGVPSALHIMPSRTIKKGIKREVA